MHIAQAYRSHNSPLGQLLVGGLEVVLVDGAVDVALGRQELQGRVHLAPGHLALHLDKNTVNLKMNVRYS